MNDQEAFISNGHEERIDIRFARQSLHVRKMHTIVRVLRVRSGNAELSLKVAGD